MARPSSNEYAPFYRNYIDKVPDGDLMDLLFKTSDAFQAFYATLDESKGNFAYAPDKWTIKQVLQHIIDTERVMQYRAMRIARHDKTPLPGFEQDDYAAIADVSHRSIASLLVEFQTVRLSSIALFRSLPSKDLLHIGIASDCPVSVRALGYIIIGHQLHHDSILKERYLVLD